MLRNGEHAFLMYLREEGDSGFTSRSQVQSDKMISFTLENGQVDQHPAHWCVGISECLKAFSYFAEHDGARTPDVIWHED